MKLHAVITYCTTHLLTEWLTVRDGGGDNDVVSSFFLVPSPPCPAACIRCGRRNTRALAGEITSFLRSFVAFVHCVRSFVAFVAFVALSLVSRGAASVRLFLLLGWCCVGVALAGELVGCCIVCRSLCACACACACAVRVWCVHWCVSSLVSW